MKSGFGRQHKMNITLQEDNTLSLHEQLMVTSGGFNQLLEVKHQGN